MKGFLGLLLGSFLLFSCTGQPQETVIYHQAQGQYLFHTLDGARTTVIINHQEIPGFMDAMAMPFPLEDPSLVEGMGAGQDITFRIAVREDGSFFVDRIQKIEVASP